MNNANVKSGSYSKIIAIILFFALTVGNYFQYQLTPLAGQLMTDLGITQNQFSSIFTSPMITSIILGIVAGVLADKFGIKKVIAVSPCHCSRRTLHTSLCRELRPAFSPAWFWAVLALLF